MLTKLSRKEIQLRKKALLQKKEHIENRVFKDYYPQELTLKAMRKGELTDIVVHGLKRSHGIKTIKKGMIDSIGYNYVIESNDTDGGFRQYPFSFFDIVRNKSKKPNADYFRGFVTESIARVVVSQMLHRQKGLIGLDSIKNWKWNTRDSDGREPIKMGKHYYAAHISRYQVSVYKKTNDENTTEFDGVFTYTAGGIKGALILEAKSGELGHFKTARTKDHKDNLERFFLHPIRDLFSDYDQVDLILAAPSQQILDPDYKRTHKEYHIIQPRLVSLSHHLQSQNVGLIPLVLNESQEELRKIGRDINNVMPFLPVQFFPPPDCQQLWWMPYKGNILTFKAEKLVGVTPVAKDTYLANFVKEWDKKYEAL